MKEIKIILPYQSISGTTKETLYKLKPNCNGVDYYSIEDLCIMFKLSDRTIERYIKKTNEKEQWRYILRIENRRYISPGIIYINRATRKKLLNVEYAKWLSTYSWTHAITVSFEVEHSKKKVRELMTTYWKQVKEQYPNERMVLFYTTEKYTDSNGYHLHAILKLDDQNIQQPIQMANTHFKKAGGNLHEEKFEARGRYIDYILKYLHHDNDGHDFEYQ